MAFRNKFNLSCIFPASFSNATIASFIFVIISVCNVAVSQNCRQINNCKCKFPNGSVIDLTSLGYEHEARFKNLSATIKDNYRYYYNPCYPFSIGAACTNVAVCQVSKDLQYQNCGNPNGGFSWNSQTNALNLIYDAEPRKTNVTLICSRDAVTPKLEVVGERVTNLYEMTLTTMCACPDMCHESHLSAGSVLVIIFMIFVSLYLFLGIIHSSLTRGAHGWELIPHYEFWADFPLLVRDGCVFVMSGCKADTAYERI